MRGYGLSSFVFWIMIKIWLIIFEQNDLIVSFLTVCKMIDENPTIQSYNFPKIIWKTSFKAYFVEYSMKW